VYYISRPSHPPAFDHCNNTRWRYKTWSLSLRSAHHSLVTPPSPVSTLSPKILHSLLFRLEALCGKFLSQNFPCQDSLFPSSHKFRSHSQPVRTFDSKTTHDLETQRRQSGSCWVPTDATFSCPALSAPNGTASTLTASLGDLRTAKCLPAPPHFDCTKFAKRLLSGRELPFARVARQNFGLSPKCWIKPLTYSSTFTKHRHSI
jgi:hypothetical protein